MHLYIITITKSGRIVRLQMDREDSVRDFCWWILVKGYTVRIRKGITVNLSQHEQALGAKLVNEFSGERTK